MKIFKSNLFVTVASLLFLSTKINTESDCEYLKSALKYLNDDMKNHFKLDKCCDFNGVRCDADKNIHELRFNNVNKTNNFEKFIEKVSNMKNLTYLDLANDNIEGAIPKTLCSMTSLKNLNLSKNKLKGAIPYTCDELVNLEQVNLKGNSDLFGYVPLFPKVRGCAFKESGLCDVSNSLCKNAPKNCTEEDIKKTNAANGYPEPDSTTYRGSDVRERDPRMYENYNDYSYGYSGYDDYSNYGSYDTSNYYGGDYGYGYGDWGYTNGYDNSYYDSGYYGTGYDDNYNGFGYDTSYYDNGYYDNAYGYGNYDNSYGYGNYDNGYGYGNYDNGYGNYGNGYGNGYGNNGYGNNGYGNNGFGNYYSGSYRNANVNFIMFIVVFTIFCIFRNL